MHAGNAARWIVVNLDAEMMTMIGMRTTSIAAAALAAGSISSPAWAVCTPASNAPAPQAFSGAVVIPSSWPNLGQVVTRTTNQMLAAGRNNNFMIGTEATDRDLSIYDNWRQCLAELGARKTRVQAGWADVEKSKGVYS